MLALNHKHFIRLPLQSVSVCLQCENLSNEAKHSFFLSRCLMELCLRVQSIFFPTSVLGRPALPLIGSDPDISLCWMRSGSTACAPPNPETAACVARAWNENELLIFFYTKKILQCPEPWLGGDTEKVWLSQLFTGWRAHQQRLFFPNCIILY